jgi:hypothetical protein
MQPTADATVTAPQENFSHTGIPSIFSANAAVSFLSLEANPTNSLGVGILAKVFPSLLLIKPLGGHTGEGDGVIFAFLVAATVAVCAEWATGAIKDSARTSAITFLIAVPFELAHTKENSNDEPDS